MSVLFNFDYLEVKMEMTDMLMYVCIISMCIDKRVGFNDAIRGSPVRRIAIQ